MMGLEIRNRVPFRDVYVHGTILDELGRKMSKSLGNGIDPLLMIDQYGADAVRTSIIMLTVEGQDVKLNENKFEMGRNFMNKVWNAARFAIMNLQSDGLPDAQIKEDDYLDEDKWIIGRLNSVTDICTNSLEKYRFNEAIRTLYEFIWNDFCDWYLEAIKPRLYNTDDKKSRMVAQKVLVDVLNDTLHLLHPFAPFMTEEIWQHLKNMTSQNESMKSESLMISRWPGRDEARINKKILETMPLLQDIVRAVRNIRRNLNIPNKQKIKVQIEANNEEDVKKLDGHHEFLEKMANLSKLEIGVRSEDYRTNTNLTEVVEVFQIFAFVEDMYDKDKERKKQLEHLNKAESHLGVVQKKLHNESFVKNAPEKIVNAEKDKETELLGQITKIKEALQGLEKSVSN